MDGTVAKKNVALEAAGSPLAGGSESLSVF